MRDLSKATFGMDSKSLVIGRKRADEYRKGSFVGRDLYVLRLDNRRGLGVTSYCILILSSI